MSTSQFAVDPKTASNTGNAPARVFPMRAGTNFSADMLQRTISAAPRPDWPAPTDRFALERAARDLRREYIAALIGRAKAAIARLVAPRGHGRTLTSK
ncbi:MAG: hypothetical protein ABI612_19690 [Betaproteobacteria bacterium]